MGVALDRGGTEQGPSPEGFRLTLALRGDHVLRTPTRSAPPSGVGGSQPGRDLRRRLWNRGRRAIPGCAPGSVHHAPLAQLVEHPALNRRVPGSNPGGRTRSLARVRDRLPAWRNWQTRWVQVPVPFGAWGFETPGGYGERRWRAPPKWSGERCRESAPCPLHQGRGRKVRAWSDALRASVPRSPDCVASPSGGIGRRDGLRGHCPTGRPGSSPGMGTMRPLGGGRSSGCGAVGSAPALGAGGPRFESGYPDAAPASVMADTGVWLSLVRASR